MHSRSPLSNDGPRERERGFIFTGRAANIHISWVWGVGRTGVDRKFKIRLEKTVPAQAGLGGGSGNAATALWGCNELCKANGLPTCTHEV